MSSPPLCAPDPILEAPLRARPDPGDPPAPHRGRPARAESAARPRRRHRGGSGARQRRLVAPGPGQGRRLRLARAQLPWLPAHLRLRGEEPRPGHRGRRLRRRGPGGPFAEPEAGEDLDLAQRGLDGYYTIHYTLYYSTT